MNDSPENHQPPTTEDLQDRLVDFALREAAGNETPPDLSAKILAANVQPAAAVGAANGSTELAEVRTAHFNSRTRRRAYWVGLAVAAMLLVAVTIATLPRMDVARKPPIEMGGQFNRLNSLSKSKATSERRAANTPAAPPPYYDTEWRQVPTISSTPSLAGPGTDQRAAIGQNGGEMFRVDQYSVAPHESRDKKWAAYGGTLVSKPLSGAAANGNMATDQTSVASAHGRGEGIVAFTDDLASQRAPKARALLQTDAFGGEEGETIAVPGFAPLTPAAETELGTGPGLSGDQYTRIFENPFIKAEGGDAVSTFSIDVDTASYANVRQFIMGMNTLPPPDAVRIEELINYFDYDYAGPNSEAEEPFAAHVEVAGCPWNGGHRLVRIGIKGREMDQSKRPRSNLVFLVDISGSMNDPNKLPLVVYGLEQLTRELGENDRVAIVVYASSEGLVLPSTPGSEQATILAALSRLQAGGSTAGGAGIQLAYQIAEDHFIEGGTNRVILCTDGDFNVGVSSTAELERLCEQKAKDTRVFLSVLGFGRGNLNDAMMEAISNRGNGNYHYVDGRTEARRVLVEEMTGTLVTIAKDVKIQVEFNPRQVAGYRLIGYENRMLRTEDFNDDKKDAGEIGAGHTVTALYEIVPTGKAVAIAPVDDLKYQPSATATVKDGEAEDVNRELLTLKMRYKQPEGDTSRKLEWAITDGGKAFAEASSDFQFAAAVAGFGLMLRDSQHKGNLTLAAVLELAQSAIRDDMNGYRAEFLEMVRRVKTLRGE